MKLKREHHFNFWYIVLAMWGVVLVHDLLTSPAPTRTISYSAFQQAVAEGRVSDAVVGQTTITGQIKAPGVEKPGPFSTVRVPTDIADMLAKAHVTFSGEPGPGFLTQMIGWLLPSAGFLLIWFFLLRRLAGGQGASGLMAIGKSKARVYVERDIKVTFADVAGVDEARDELKEVVAFLKDPARYGRLGAHMPKGVLLVGPPGTGKTLLARAVAGEASVPFFSISGSEFVEMFVGVGAARVRDLFDQARQMAPAIIFIDELDALGRVRGSVFPGGGHDEKEQTLNQLLTEMDGFDSRVGVVLLAATNRPEILDPALLRAGRFDRQVLVDRPGRQGRADILRVHIKAVKLAPDVSIDTIAALTPGFTGADLANLINEAALLATRTGADSVALPHFTEAIERIVAGLEKRQRLLNPREREIVAHHETGHALVAMALPGTDPVQKISIIPRGVAALGYTIQRPTEDRYLMSRTELMDRMAVLLGGRCAEQLAVGEISTGAADDLAKATDIARAMVARFGMDPDLGQVSYEPEQTSILGNGAAGEWRPRHYAEQTASRIDAAIRRLIEQAAKTALGILTVNRDLLERTATELLAGESLSADELATVHAQLVLPKPDQASDPAVTASAA